MLFNSATFILFFLPISLVLYFLAPGKIKNGVLLAESLVFYSYGALKYLPLLILLVLADYVFGRILGSSSSGKKKKTILITGILINIGLLLVFKYGSYLSDLIDRIGNGQIELLDVLPLGVSYFTFKSSSYLFDVYRRKCEPETSLIDFATYVVMYPQMIVGPIIRYVDIRDALKQTGSRFNPEKCAAGIRMFVYGLAKKVILADSLGLMWQELAGENGIRLSQASSGLVWFAVLSFSLQLYLDFSGYSEMSNGLSKIMGFDCKDNFDYPYCAASFTQFWRRWHITLTEWFRDYVYIPLGGSRTGIARQIVNMLIVWILTGIWHGSTINYLIWGLYCFLFLVIEKYGLRSVIKNEFFGRVFTLFAAVVGWEYSPRTEKLRQQSCLQNCFHFPAEYQRHII